MTQPAEVAEASSRAPVPPPSRRDRLRAATIEEIIQTARRLLVKDGPEAVSLRAIAREMGMTAPGLYRYFGSHEELLRHVCAGIFTELGRGHPPGHRGGRAAGGRAPAILRGEADRQDGRRLPRVPPLGAEPQGRVRPAVRRAAARPGRRAVRHRRRVRAGVRRDLLHAVPRAVERRPVPGARPTSRSTRACATSSAAIATRWAPACPDGAVLMFLRCWTLLYGAVAMEVFGHLGFALDDPAPDVRAHPRRPGRPGRPAVPATWIGERGPPARAERDERGRRERATPAARREAGAPPRPGCAVKPVDGARGTATSRTTSLAGLSRSGSAAPAMPASTAAGDRAAPPRSGRPSRPG